MPEFKKGQTKSEYIDNCIAWIKSNEPDKKDWSSNRLYEYCEGLWDNAKNAGELNAISEQLDTVGYKPFAFTSDYIGIGKFEDGTISMSGMSEEFESDGETIRKYDVVDAIAAIGDMFYGNMFVSSEVFRASAHLWNSTLNDLSHMGTMFPAGMGSVENMEYITGYNSDASFNEATKALHIKMHIAHNAPKYNVWKSYVDISKDSKKTPNVSIFGFYKSKALHKDKLPAGIVIPNGALYGNYVTSMTDIIPFAVSTCLKGKCDDKTGCGISSGFTDIQIPCADGSCETGKITTKEIEINEPITNEKIDIEKINRLKNRIKELKK